MQLQSARGVCSLGDQARRVQAAMQLSALQHLMRQTLRRSSGGHLKIHCVRMKLSAAYAVMYMICSETCFCQWLQLDKVCRSHHFSMMFGFISGYERCFVSGSYFLVATTGQRDSRSIALLSAATFIAVVTILSQPCE